MKHQYFGDVNDYVKYALLRHLGRAAGCAVQVCWMLTPPDARSDGSLVGYLRNPDRWRAGDPPLFDHLAACVAARRRHLRHIESDAWLPAARFHRDALLDDARARDAYFERLWQRAAGADLIFFDPDNGFEAASTRRGRRGSSRYLYWHEAAEAQRRGFSTLTFQHFPRVPREPYVARLRARAERETGGAAHIVCTPRVAYVLLAQPPRAAPLERAFRSFEATWSPILRGARRHSPLMNRAATMGRP